MDLAEPVREVRAAVVPVQLYNRKRRGWGMERGVVAAGPMKNGQLIMPYDGERMSAAEHVGVMELLFGALAYDEKKMVVATFM